MSSLWVELVELVCGACRVSGWNLFRPCLQYQSQDLSPIDGFIIYYKEYDSDEPFTRHVIKGDAIRSYIISRLKPNTHYVVEIASYNAAGQGPVSVDVVEKTLATGQCRCLSVCRYGCNQWQWCHFITQLHAWC